ncbi:MAG: 16S rRNA (uracil(1498)-N(3))-methyltransferase [Nitrospirae bacterium]|nr:16S rRNA (uracil(1498)-N(3))-methyltransferase [Nitrospirota bacterium]
MPRFMINSNDIQNGRLVLSGTLFHHIKNSLRYQINDLIKVIDENQISYQAQINRITPDTLEAVITQKEPVPSTSGPRIILVQALVKKKKMDLLLEKAAELGVSEIFPVVTDRTVVHPLEDRWEHQRSRWESILLEASQQSEQPAPPEIHPPEEFRSFLQRKRNGLGFIFWEKETQPFKQRFSLISPAEPSHSIYLIIGPEGGFQQNEIELSQEKGYISVSLGRQKLRSETAVMVAITLLQYELGYFGK